MTQMRVAVTPGAFTGQKNTLARSAGEGCVLLGPVVSPDQAEVALFPFDLASCLRSEYDRSELLDLVASNARRGLRTLLLLTHDHVAPLNVGQPESIVLRTSMQWSLAYCSEYPLPIVVDDPYGAGTFEPRPWTPLPVVGFIGHSGILGLHRAARAARAGVTGPVPPGHVSGEISMVDEVLKTPLNIGLYIRQRALKALRSSEIVRAWIVERDRYFFHFDPVARLQLRDEYLRHLFSSDYILCVRGAGNFSIRLFETLAAGRVPVIVDTDLALPCADVIDWQGLGVWIPIGEIDRIDEVVARSHAEDGVEGFEQRQRAARAAFVDVLSAKGFSGYVAQHLQVEWA
jgi:hypothetical protein